MRLVLLTVLLFALLPATIEASTYGDETVAVPNYNGLAEHYSYGVPNRYGAYDRVGLEIGIPNGKCERVFKDIFITKDCPSLATFVQIPTSA